MCLKMDLFNDSQGKPGFQHHSNLDTKFSHLSKVSLRAPCSVLANFKHLHRLLVEVSFFVLLRLILILDEYLHTFDARQAVKVPEAQTPNDQHTHML